MLITLQDTPALRLHPADDVAIALVPLSANRRIEIAGQALRMVSNVAAGHKLALRGIETGQPLRRYGQVIGFATRPIAPGDHVHTHNLAVGEMQLDYQFGVDMRPVEMVPPEQRRTFQGYRRADGSVGTRNTLVLISTVNCSAHTVRQIAARARAELLPRFPNVTDIVALAHRAGCASAASGPEIEMLRRTLAGFARNPNVAGYLFVGLGCETNQFEALFESQRERLGDLRLPPYIGIQDSGGVAAAIEEGLQALAVRLPHANEFERESVPVSELMLALQCGGSDSFSGITANPALGHAVDLLVAQGGTAVLSETPEIYGAEHLLTRRAASRAVGEKIVERIRWWEDHCARTGGEMNNNPSPGNKAGGLTTILEKSLGAVAKGGTTNLVDVYKYAEPITAKGFVYMDSPGYDPVSATGQVAGGANVLCFTTGRGSVFGCKPTPSLKLATNSALYRRMTDDMDINCGSIVDGEETIQESGKKIFELIVKTASGQQTKSEALGIGDDEFEPWKIGATM